MVHSGPLTVRVPGAPSLGGAPACLVCRVCVRRYRIVSVEEHPTDRCSGDAAFDGEAASADATSEPRCDCGAKLHPHVAPVDLAGSSRGVIPRLTRFWVAGREAGFWDEHRFFRQATADRVGVQLRQVRFAYQAGRREGQRLREGAHRHAMRVMRMKLGATAADATASRAAA